MAAAVSGRMTFYLGLFMLLLGGGFLTGGWAMVDEELDRRGALAFDGRAPGVIEAPWLRLDFDPELMGDATNWPAMTTVSVCARLRFEPQGERETTTHYCRRFARGAHHLDYHASQRALGPVPVRWLDERGMPRIELRLDPRLARWLEQRPREADHGDDPGLPGLVKRGDRFLEEIWRDLDDPFLWLLGEWSKPAPRVTVAYRSDVPTQAAPVQLLEQQPAEATVEGGELPIWYFGVIILLFGIVWWGAGCYAITQNRWMTALLVVGGIAALPFAAGYAGRALTYLWHDAEWALSFIHSEMLGVPPELVLGAPAAEEAEAEAEVLAWTLEASEYAPLLRWIDLEPPRQPMDDDQALRHLADQVHRQAIALPDAQIVMLLDWVQDLQTDGEDLGLLFVEPSLTLAADGVRSREVRREASRLLRDVANHPPSDNPYRLATAERQRILEQLSARVLD